MSSQLEKSAVIAVRILIRRSISFRRPLYAAAPQQASRQVRHLVALWRPFPLQSPRISFISVCQTKAGGKARVESVGSPATALGHPFSARWAPVRSMWLARPKGNREYTQGDGSKSTTGSVKPSERVARNTVARNTAVRPESTARVAGPRKCIS